LGKPIHTEAAAASEELEPLVPRETPA